MRRVDCEQMAFEKCLSHIAGRPADTAHSSTAHTHEARSTVIQRSCKPDIGRNAERYYTNEDSRKLAKLVPSSLSPFHAGPGGWSGRVCGRPAVERKAAAVTLHERRTAPRRTYFRYVTCVVVAMGKDAYRVGGTRGGADQFKVCVSPPGGLCAPVC